MNKKILSSILAGVMTVSTLGISAAADVPAVTTLSQATQTYDVTAGLNAPTIEASIPTAMQAFINPYKAIVKETGYVDSFASGIASPTYHIENGMSDKLAVTVTPTIKSSKTVELSETPLNQEGLTDKMVFAYLNTTTFVDSQIPVFRNTHYDANDKTQAVFKEEGETTANIMIIDATSGKGYFRVEGECTETPEEKWSEKDTISLSVVLDLAPSAGEAKDASLAVLEVKGGKDSANATKINFAEPNAFDPSVTNYTIKAASMADDLAYLSISCTLNDTVSSGTNVYVLFNGTRITGSSTPAQGVVSEVQVNTAGTNYKVGDVIEVIVKNDIYSQTYKITVVA